MTAMQSLADANERRARGGAALDANQASDGTSGLRPERPAVSSRDLSVLRQLFPGGRPRGDGQAYGLGPLGDLGREGVTDLVVVAELQPVLPVEGVFRRAGPPEDVHGP